MPCVKSFTCGRLCLCVHELGHVSKEENKYIVVDFCHTHMSLILPKCVCVCVCVCVRACEASVSPSVMVLAAVKPEA